MTPQHDDLRKYKRHLANARRELKRAVERFAEIDPLAGHRAEAVRLARAVKEAADEAVTALERSDERGE